MGLASGHFGEEDGQLFVGKIEGIGAVLPPAVVAHQPLVLTVGVELLELPGRCPTGAVAAIQEDGGIGGRGASEVRAKLPDDVVAGRVAVFEDLDGQRTPVERIAEIVAKVLDVVDAAVQCSDSRRVVVNTNKQCVEGGHGRATAYTGRQLD